MSVDPHFSICSICSHPLTKHGQNGCEAVSGGMGCPVVPCECGKLEAVSQQLENITTSKLNVGNYVGMPAGHYLHEFGSQIQYAFDNNMAYLVGSATTSKTWRDVDVRLILSDEEFEALNIGKPGDINGKKAALEMAFAELGKRMTGLPIDFQIQQMTDANEKYKGQPRMALGFVELRMAK